MPLATDTISTKPEHASSSVFRPLVGPIKDRLATIFGVPPLKSVNGVVLNKHGAIYYGFRDKIVIPAIQRTGIDPLEVNDLSANLSAELHHPFERGALSIAFGEAYPYQFQSTLYFYPKPTIAIQHETISADPKNLMVMISHNSVFASIPRDVLLRVEKARPLVLIEQSAIQDPGYYSAALVKLQRKTNGVIEASNIIAANGVLNNWIGREKEARKVIKGASEVFFLVD